MKNNLEFSGLSQKNTAEILKVEGLNELSTQKKKNIFFALFKVLTEPMLLLLIAAGVIYLFLGEVSDSMMLLFAVFVVIGITFYQERKTEKTLDALKDLSSPKALVIRDGEQKLIDSKQVVRGDIIIIREGDRVPADSTILSCENLSADESLLTGESNPVRKLEWDGKLANQRPGGDDLPFIYSGTLITSGHGVARVNFIGALTEIGKIGKSLENIKDEDTLLRKETTRIVRWVALIGLILCVLVVLFYTILKGNFVAGLLAGITLSMAILPEEFPVVLLIFLTLGAWRISRRKVLTRHSAAIETLGAATVLCTDKTGTITLNKMELSSLYFENSFYEVSDFATTNLPEKFEKLLEFSVLASQKDAYDPIEKEINKMGGLYLKNFENKYQDFELKKEYSLSKKLLALSHVWQSKKQNKIVIASKGAPEAILDLCHIDQNKQKEILEIVKEMAEKGLRVLGIAEAVYSNGNLPEDQHDFIFKFVGLLGFIDPIRASVPDAIREAHEAGMRVIMITGDYPGTAKFIAKNIGISNPEKYLTGEDLEKLSHLELREQIKTINVFARVIPEQKLLIVNALKANDEIVTMTGDGVNDAPALKAAHIGVAMGERGTDVAREASALILLNDDFSSIVSAVRLGRRIYDNLKRAMGYILAVHVPIAGMSVLPLAFGLPVVLFPAHIAFMELIIDPACSTVFEAEKPDKNIMKRPPRNLRQKMFDSRTILINLAQGFAILIGTFLLFFHVIKSGRSESDARSLAFASLVISNLFLIVINLSWKKHFYQIIRSANKIFISVFLGALVCLAAVLYIPFFATLFHLAPLNFIDILLVLLTTFASLFWFEVLKWFQNDKYQKKSA
ncbi:MAG: cation-translocating P-type ATPase [Patescibacteria group bacterium]